MLPIFKEEEMTKIHTKLLVFFGVLLCSLCLIFGIAACSNGEHVHTFSSEWKSNATIHWHAATCIHAGERSEQGEHNFNNQGKCTVCGYQSTEEHEHTFAGAWLFDGAEGHYRLATCHPEVKSELEPHVDENEDDICDVCDYDMSNDVGSTEHEHTFAEEWTFNEAKHWHNATCEHFTERIYYADHVFIQGVCPCGVKESQVKVYELYKNSPEYDLYFPQWLDWLAENGITSVEYTESGDGIYHYADGTQEVRFLGSRTIKVKAQSDGEPLSDVWFMVTLFTNNEYYQTNGTMALGIAKTDESGIAEIAFNPVGGYSSVTVQYRIRVALAADVAIALGIKEENAKPIPNRYEVSGTNSEYIAYEVSENSNAEDIAATVNFKFSKGWNAYEQFTLPYARYYEKPYEGEDLKETGTTYEFTTSGENLFDYFYFTPSNKYSFASADGSFTPEQLAVIVENFQKAASGIYKIYFTYEGNANVTLYYWNEGGVNMRAYHQTKPDGTPSDDYITSISGGTAGNGKYTGGNFVNVTVTPANGLREFQFGIISDAAVKITFTVERVSDYVIETNGSITLGDNNNITLLGNGEVTALTLKNVPAGYYFLTVNTTETAAKQSGMFSAYVDVKDTAPLWDGSQIKGIINIPEGTEVLYIVNYHTADTLKVSINLTTYQPPVVKEGEEITVPISGIKDIKRVIYFDESVTSGTYKLELTLSGGQALSGALWYVRVVVGDNDYSIFLPTSTNYSELVTEYISVNKGDTLSIYILGKKTDSNYISSAVNGKLKLTAFPFIEQGVTVSTELSRDEGTSKEYVFIATREGTYNLSIIQTNEPELLNDWFGYTTLTVLKVTNSLTDGVIKDYNLEGETDINECNKSCSTTFTLQEGETAVLKFTNMHNNNHLNIEFTIEFVEG